MQGDNELISVQAATSVFPSNPGPDTISRWMRIGVRGIKLKYRLVSGRKMTTRGNCERFMRAVHGSHVERWCACKVLPKKPTAREKRFEAFRRDFFNNSFYTDQGKAGAE